MYCNKTDCEVSQIFVLNLCISQLWQKMRNSNLFYIFAISVLFLQSILIKSGLSKKTVLLPGQTKFKENRVKIIQTIYCKTLRCIMLVYFGFVHAFLYISAAWCFFCHVITFFCVSTIWMFYAFLGCQLWNYSTAYPIQNIGDPVTYPCGSSKIPLWIQ